MCITTTTDKYGPPWPYNLRYLPGCEDGATNVLMAPRLSTDDRNAIEPTAEQLASPKN